jgi:hypothetical protein
MANFYNVANKNISDVATTYLTSTSDSTIILSILVSNTAGTNSDVTINLLDSGSAVEASLATTLVIPADSNVDIIGNKFILPSGKSLSFGSSTSGTLDAITSYVEV